MAEVATDACASVPEGNKHDTLVTDIDAWISELMMDYDIRKKFNGDKEILRNYCEYYIKSPEVFEEQNEKFKTRDPEPELTQSELEANMLKLKEDCELHNVEIKNME